MARLETELLILRPVRRSDASSMIPLINNFEISKWLSRVACPYGEAEAEEFFEAVLDNDNPDHARPFAILSKDEPDRMIGCIAAEPHEVEGGVLSEAAEFGYWIGEPFWGRGFVSEAAFALLPVSFDLGGYHKLTAGYLEGNGASARILEKCGFVDIGPKTIFCTARGKDVPGRDLELTRERWGDLNL